MVWVSLSNDKNDFLTAPPPRRPAAQKSSSTMLKDKTNKNPIIIREKYRMRDSFMKMKSSSLDVMPDENLEKKKLHVVHEAEDILAQKPPEDLFDSDCETHYAFGPMTLSNYMKYEQKVNIKIHPSSKGDSSDEDSINLPAMSSNEDKTTPPTQDPFPEPPDPKTDYDIGKFEDTDEDYQSREFLKSLQHKPEREGLTMLMSVCQQGLEHDVRDLLQRKKNMISLKDRTGKTAFHYCAENQNLTCMEQLIAVRPDMIDSQDNDGFATLHLRKAKNKYRVK